jgi:hypothetical protein
MKPSRILSSSLLAMGLVAAAVLACDERAPDPAEAVRPATRAARHGERSAADGESAKRQFHAGNQYDWVGVAHNRAIDEFRVRLRRGEIPHDQCNYFVDYLSAAERLLPEQRASAADRALLRRFARRGLELGHCAGRIVGAAGMTVGLAQATDVSPATHAMLDQVASAASLATSSGELAVTLVPIVQASTQLPGDEPLVVQAAASVAQSSTEYWEVNLEATKQDYNNAYGACIGQYPTPEEAASACLGLSGGGPAPTRYRVRPREGTVWLAGATRFDCRRVNGKEIVGDDVKGGIGGAIGGFIVGLAGGPAAPVTSTSGILLGALGAGAGASIGAIGWQWAQETWCVLRGGGGGPATVNPT